VGFTIVCFGCNIWGMSVLSKLSWVLFIIMFIPFVILNFYIPLGEPRVAINWDNVVNIPPLSDVVWSPLISSVVWNLDGNDYIGSIAGEVKGGRKTYIIAILIVMPLSIINFGYPILLAYLIDGNNSHWVSGYLTDVIRIHCPVWLGLLSIISFTLSVLGASSAGMSQLSWTVWAMSKGKSDNVAKYRYLPYFLSWSWHRGKITQPIASLIFISILTLLLTFFKIETMSQIYLMLRSVNLLLVYGALITLKVREPGRIRPFKIPGGPIGSAVMVVPSLVIIAFSLSKSDAFSLEVGAGIIVGIALAAPVKKLGLLIYDHWKKRKIVVY